VRGRQLPGRIGCMGGAPWCQRHPWLRAWHGSLGNRIMLSFICAASSRCGGAGERAADALHCLRVDAKPSSDFARALGTPRLVQGRTDALFQLGWYRRPARFIGSSPISLPESLPYLYLKISRTTKRKHVFIEVFSQRFGRVYWYSNAGVIARPTSAVTVG
jgi:hypothetical protein